MSFRRSASKGREEKGEEKKKKKGEEGEECPATSPYALYFRCGCLSWR